MAKHVFKFVAQMLKKKDEPNPEGCELDMDTFFKLGVQNQCFVEPNILDFLQTISLLDSAKK